MKKKVYRLVIITTLLCIFVIAVNACIGGWVSYNINRYVSLTKENHILPKLDELGKYEEANFKFYRNNMLIFKSDAYILKVSYDEEHYTKQKDLLSEKYIYQTEPISDGYDGITFLNEPSFVIDTFEMNLLSNQEYGMIYPHELIFIGASDEKKTITYVYYFNQDLDYIDRPFKDFLKSDCGW